ncbi:unnamed protein product [Owenia fusiformis]|uniref:Uncharacterized protein n=1 Tax=Owenia fusiformis TaxID=6347 RepID=A0A8J1XIS7_OWEFU|nr:unnamed protein product [Owenia fusiformis]
MKKTLYLCIFTMVISFSSINFTESAKGTTGCDSNPCLNGATCTTYGKGDDAWMCTCTPYYTNLQCDTPITIPTTVPTTHPTTVPTTHPTTVPTTEPTTEPTTVPTTHPTTVPTTHPTTVPTTEPTTVPTTEPPTVPTTEPTTEPTTVPTTEPTTVPTTEQTTVPTTVPTTEPTTDPTTCYVHVCENGGTCIRDQETAVEQCICPYPTGGISCQLNPKPYHISSFMKMAGNEKVPTPDWTFFTRSILECSKKAILHEASAFNFHTLSVDYRHTCEVIIDSGNLRVPSTNWNYYELR